MAHTMVCATPVLEVSNSIMWYKVEERESPLAVVEVVRFRGFIIGLNSYALDQKELITYNLSDHLASLHTL